MKINRGKIILILILMSISISVLVYSFAYTTTTHTGEDSSYLMVSEILFGLTDAVESISLEEQTPTIDKFGIVNDAFSFSITNTGTKEQEYTLRLVDKDAVSTIQNEELRYQLTRNGVVESIKDMPNSGVIDSGIIAKGETYEYSIIVWLSHDAVTSGGTWDKVVKVEAGTINIDGSGANEPILLDNMFPVYYDNDENVWRKADRTNSNSDYQWYDYDDRMWANIVTINNNGIYSEKVTQSQSVNVKNADGYVSGNFNVNSSTSEMTLTVTSPNDTNFSFDYAVSSESNFDKLTITVDGTTVVNAISGENSGTHTMTLTAGKEHVIVAKYAKDNSAYKGSDKATISNLVYEDGVVVSFSSTGTYPWKNLNTIGTSYSYNDSNGVYTLTNIINDVISSNLVGNFICDDITKSTCTTMYKIIEADTTVTNVDVYDSNTDLKRDYYINATEGTEISLDDISMFYVWIPRFKYDLFASGSGELINITFEQGTANTGTMKCTIKNGVEICSGETTSYTHPAFTFGDEELTGYWINKFELSPESSTTCYSSVTSTNCDINSLSITSKPNQKSLNYISIGNLFYSVRNMEVNGNLHGFTNVGTSVNGDGTIVGDNNNYDVHLSRNFETAALSYLVYSKYGKYSNTLYGDEDKIVFDNNSSTKTGSSYVNGTTYDYNIDYYGVGASSTGNVYGVYDLNGKISEYVMANVLSSSGDFRQNSNYSAKFTSNPLIKYYDGYAFASMPKNLNTFYGDAITEFSGFLNPNYALSLYPFLTRYSIDVVDVKYGTSNSSGLGGSIIGGRSVITIEQDVYITKW